MWLSSLWLRCQKPRGLSDGAPVHRGRVSAFRKSGMEKRTHPGPTREGWVECRVSAGCPRGSVRLRFLGKLGQVLGGVAVISVVELEGEERQGRHPSGGCSGAATQGWGRFTACQPPGAARGERETVGLRRQEGRSGRLMCLGLALHADL